MGGALLQEGRRKTKLGRARCPQTKKTLSDGMHTERQQSCAYKGKKLDVTAPQSNALFLMS